MEYMDVSTRPTSKKKGEEHEIFYLQQELEKYKIFELKFKILSENHSTCENKISEFQEKISILEEENAILRKEVLEYNKIDNSDWLLSSDSEDNESVHTLMKEKNLLESNIQTLHVTISDQLNKIKDKEKSCSELEKLSKEKDEIIKELKMKLDDLSKEKEDKIKDLTVEIEDVKKKSMAYQELSVILSKQNSDLISELGRNKEMCYEYIADFSSVSSTDSSKCEIYRIIEEKDTKVSNLLENSKLADEKIQKLKEKYFTDISAYKKQVARLKHELSLSKSENIKENAQAMKVLEDLKQEKTKLLNIISSFSDNTEKKKIAELKEVNSMLMQNLQKKGQQIAELHAQFQEFLNYRGCSQDVIEKLSRKTEKLKNLKREFLRIKTYLLKFSQFRYKIEKMPLSECIIDIFTYFFSKKNVSKAHDDKERLNFSHS